LVIKLRFTALERWATVGRTERAKKKKSVAKRDRRASEKKAPESKRRARGNELQARTIGRGEGDAAKKGEAVDVTRKKRPSV